MWRSQQKRLAKTPRRVTRVPLAVDTVELGPIGTNCHLVRAEHGSTDAVVVDPSGSAAEIRLRLASSGRSLRGRSCSRTATGTTSSVSPSSPTARALRSGCRATRSRSSGTLAAVYQGLGVSVPAYAGDATLVAGGETGRGGRDRVRGRSPCPGTRRDMSPTTRTATSSPATCCSPAASAAPTSRAATGRRCSARSGRSLDRYPAETVVHSGHGPETTLGAELAPEPVPRRAPRRPARRPDD